MQDYAMFWTVRMLMVVEYANWDMQKAIGYNCGNGSEAEATGSTDSMPYHTGTVQSALTTYGVGVQYRYIEDPWGNVYEWVDGWRSIRDDTAKTCDIYVYTNPATYSDTKGGAQVCHYDTQYPSGWITDWNIPTKSGMDWAMQPVFGSGGGSSSKIAVHAWVGYPCLCVGGYWSLNGNHGAFFMDSGSVDYYGDFVGARLQKIP